MWIIVTSLNTILKTDYSYGIKSAGIVENIIRHPAYKQKFGWIKKYIFYHEYRVLLHSV